MPEVQSTHRARSTALADPTKGQYSHCPVKCLHELIMQLDGVHERHVSAFTKKVKTALFIRSRTLTVKPVSHKYKVSLPGEPSDPEGKNQNISSHVERHAVVLIRKIPKNVAPR